MKPIKAVIFDMDELMVNSHAVHMKVHEAVLNKYSVSLKNSKNPLTKSEEATFFGMKIKDILAYLHKKYNLNGKVSLEELNSDFNKILLPIFAKQVEAMPGIVELIRSLQGEYKLVVASSAKRAKIDIVLKKLGITDIFDAIVSGEDEIKHGKPAPDIFLKAAEKISINPENCLVLEDAKNGVDAAKAAGMVCIGVHNKYTYEAIGEKQNLSGADIEVDSLYEAQELIQKLF